MRQYFEDWMVRNERKSKNTAYQYANSIDKISKHYSENENTPTNIYSITDSKTIQSISNDYAKEGKYSSFGDKGNATIRNAIATYLRCVQNSNVSNFESESTEIQAVEQPEEITNFTYERDLQNSLIVDIPTLFPGYKIFKSIAEGVEYSIEGKIIDVLLENEENGDLKVIELKSGIANFKAFGQISMYLGLLSRKFPNKVISGVIIAGAIDDSLTYACLTSDKVGLMTYQMKLELTNV